MLQSKETLWSIWLQISALNSSSHLEKEMGVPLICSDFYTFNCNRKVGEDWFIFKQKTGHSGRHSRAIKPPLSAPWNRNGGFIPFRICKSLHMATIRLASGWGNAREHAHSCTSHSTNRLQVIQRDIGLCQQRGVKREKVAGHRSDGRFIK